MQVAYLVRALCAAMPSLSFSAFVASWLDKRLNKSLNRRTFEARQLRKFRALAHILRARSPYYARIMDERRIEPARCRPQDFPVLTKADVIQHFDEIITAPEVTKRAVTDFLSQSHDAAELFRGRYIIVHSSGTTGEPGCFVYSSREWSWGGAALCDLRGFGVLSTRRRKVAFIGATRDHLAGISIMSTFRSAVLRPFFEFESFDVNYPFHRVVDGLNAFRPDLLVGYGLALATLAERQLNGELAIRPMIVTNSGEAISKADRDRVKLAFGVDVRNVYTSSEHMFMAVQEPDSAAMRLLEDDLIFEFFPDHTLVTNLFNRTFPLIRYRMGDALDVDVDLNVNAPYRAVREIAGRAEQAPVFVNKHGERDWLSPHLIYSFVVKNVQRHQLVQLNETSFVFSVVLGSALSDQDRRVTVMAVRNRLLEILTEKGMENVDFQINEVSDILADQKTGKFLMITKA